MTGLEMYGPGKGGMRLTAAVIAAGVKYPRESAGRHEPSLSQAKDGRRWKKFGFFQKDKGAFDWVVQRTGLPLKSFILEGATVQAWSRHPLAFLVEAADDICNSVLDLEDGVRFGRISSSEVVSRLAPIAKRPSSPADPANQISSYRATAIHQLISEVLACFSENEDQILDGSLMKPLAKLIPSSQELSELQDLARRECYCAPSVLEIEMAGSRILDTLLTELADDLRAIASLFDSSRDVKLARRLGLSQISVKDDATAVHAAIDYVSGMTDGFARNLYQRILGVNLPGGHG